MKQLEFEDKMEAVFDELRVLQSTKGHDYGRDDDAFAFLRDQAADFNVPVEVVWGIMAGKHWTAVVKHCRGGVESEPIKSRIFDLILYLLILYAIETDP